MAGQSENHKHLMNKHETQQQTWGPPGKSLQLDFVHQMKKNIESLSLGCLVG